MATMVLLWNPQWLLLLSVGKRLFGNYPCLVSTPVAEWVSASSIDSSDDGPCKMFWCKQTNGF